MSDISPDEFDWENAETRPPLPLGKSPIRLEDGVMRIDEHGHFVGTAVRQCYDNVHVWEKRPGVCQCGSEWWDAP